MYIDSVANQIDREKAIGGPKLIVRYCSTWLHTKGLTNGEAWSGWLLDGGTWPIADYLRNSSKSLELPRFPDTLEKGLGDAVDGQVAHVSHQWSEQARGAVRGSQLETRRSGDGEAQRMGGITDTLM
ncbi:uncharacterized protein EI90DRAFT_3022480 [Cantharellus anzutake]|uniref:uncharacterized protein n=1 Tax=Cantharellus anzutake TaxID=1750568 RepID=UPI001908D6B2|nr:uncharacterized protein EI90DRAFT_3022480 [Cantharellus anzutake]KAF8313939.1 hypothetical protein EI90DRAFT_3022480 [Cantharellus anzutake]